MKSIDITGIRFGRLVALTKNGFDQSPSRKHIRWDCICDCGKKINTRINSLKTGHVRSCGCLPNEGNKKHGMSNSKEYRTWIRIKERCNKINNPDYYLYGKRGINKTENFSLDRINNDGNYEPKNCRWADNATQARNKRCNRFYELNGENMCLQDWAKKIGISQSALSERLTKWSLERSLTTYKLEN